MTTGMTTNELLDLEHAGWRSLCDGTGDRFYGSLMTDDAVMVLANGMVLDRAAVTTQRHPGCIARSVLRRR